MDLAGTWCSTASSIEVSVEALPGTSEYEEFEPNFTENDPVIPYTQGEEEIRKVKERYQVIPYCGSEKCADEETGYASIEEATAAAVRAYEIEGYSGVAVYDQLEQHTCVTFGYVPGAVFQCEDEE